MTEIDNIISDVNDVMTVTQPTTGALQRIEAEARVMHTAYQLASSLSKTGMVPEAYQQDRHGEQAAYNLCAAIMYGAELGLSAVQAAQNIFIVKGKPAIYATTMAAIIRKAGFVIEPVEESDSRCVWKGYRDGSWSFSEWTIERAQQAGYTANRLYQTNPQAMLRAKCITELARIKYQDCITGMSQSIEELRLEPEGVSVQRLVPSSKKGTKGMAALRELATEDAPEDAPKIGDNTPPPNTETEQEPQLPLDDDVVTDEQVAEIKVLLKARQIVGKAILDDVSGFMGKQVTTLNDLSSTDAAAYIDSLTG